MDTNGPDAAQFALHPFRALRLDNAHVGDPMTHRILARPYRSVPGRLREWRRKRQLKLEPAPALYVHEYTSAGVTVRGVVATLDLSGTGHTVLPHEGVEASQVDQLARRMEEMGLNPAPILLVHRGPEAVRRLLTDTTTAPPELAYTDRAGQLQRIWRITDPQRISALTGALAGTRALVADGHHRLAAARRLRADHPGSAWERTLVMLIDEADTPLELCAIHRTVPGLSLGAVEARARSHGDTFVRHTTSSDALAHLHTAIVLHDGRHWATLVPGSPRELLVDWLHRELLPDLGVGEDRLVHHHAASQAISRADQGVSVLLPAPTFDQVSQWAGSGRLLPQKATSFQPKPHLGVLMRELRDE